MPPAKFEPAIPSSEQPHTHALDCVAAETGQVVTAYFVLTYVFLSEVLN